MRIVAWGFWWPAVTMLLHNWVDLMVSSHLRLTSSQISTTVITYNLIVLNLLCVNSSYKMLCLVSVLHVRIRISSVQDPWLVQIRIFFSLLPLSRWPPLGCRAGISELGPALTASRCAAPHHVKEALRSYVPPLAVRSVAGRADSSEQDRGQLLSSLLLQAAQSTACPCRRSVIMY
jgi:hypothetical protein